VLAEAYDQVLFKHGCSYLKFTKSFTSEGDSETFQIRKSEKYVRYGCDLSDGTRSTEPILLFVIEIFGGKGLLLITVSISPM
jgi:hypothetical protein